ncbi:C1 family peptidase [Aeoliella sp. SH292]|uniref:C1 family peptidase n=1 Tax=Aeoliella sp. SH292 TaxID=3454464 RepID=UPI003F9B0E99
MMSALGFALLMLFAAIGDRSSNGSPTSIDLRPGFDEVGLECGRQGKRNTCSLFAITAIANYEATARTAQAPRFSPEYLVWAANKATARRGDQAMFYEATHGLNELGIADLAAFPYTDTPGGVTPDEAMVESAAQWRHRWQVHWIKRWNVGSGLSADELIEVKRQLAAGHPVACGLRWPVQPRGNDLMEVPSADHVRDGHSIVLVGYEDDASLPGGGALMFRNSYGPEWGEGGYARMSYAYVREYGNDAVWLALAAPGTETPIERFEAEQLEIASSSNAKCEPRSMLGRGHKMWSNSRDLRCKAEEEGSVELDFPVAKPGKYRVRLLATASPESGVVEAMLDDHSPEKIDLYSGELSPAGSLELGTHELPAGVHRVTVRVLGKHPLSSGHEFGLDAIDLLPAK